MSFHVNKKLMGVFNKLSLYKRNKCIALLKQLKLSPNIYGVLLGGSLSYKENLHKSDVDFFCLANLKKFNTSEFVTLSNSLKDCDVIVDQGFFPWTGNLKTIFYKRNKDFSIDLCLIDLNTADSFFWEPKGIIIFDKKGLISKYMIRQMANPDFTNLPFLKTNPFSMAVHTLKKIHKNLSRNHLWNSIEQLSVLRRYVMQIIRLNIIKDTDFLGRVDRDIEDVIPSEINKLLSLTVPKYNASDIATKTVLLIEFFSKYLDLIEQSNEKQYEKWIRKQLRYEYSKLLHISE